MIRPSPVAEAPAISPRLRRFKRDAAALTCPVERTLRAIGGRWRLLIVRSLLLDAPQRYNQLLSAVRGISAKELTRNLRDLEQLELLTRTSNGRLTRYALTALGGELGPAFELLLPFGTKLAEAWARPPAALAVPRDRKRPARP